MIRIAYSDKATNQLDEILSNDKIYDAHGHFTQQFINWNYEFHHYVSDGTISKSHLNCHGWYRIGTIGTLEYKYFKLDDSETFEILEFRFTKLPYTTRKPWYKVVGEAGYGYKVVQSTFNNKCTLLTPQKRYLTKFVFDNIIGFHHSSDDYNLVYAVGFIGDRVYAIYQNDAIEVLPYSKEEYLKKTHKYYESKRYRKNTIALDESRLRRIVHEVLQEVLSA